MRFKFDPNIATTLLVGATILGVTQTTISAASATTDERFAQLEARINGRFESMDARFTARFEEMDARFGARFQRMDARIEKMDARIERMDARIDDVAAGIARLEGLIQGFLAASAAEDTAVSEEPG